MNITFNMNKGSGFIKCLVVQKKRGKITYEHTNKHTKQQNANNNYNSYFYRKKILKKNSN